jgi:phage protein D
MFNYLSLEFPSSQTPPQRVHSFVLHQDRYAHEFATLNLRDWDVQYSNVKPGDPVKCALRGVDGSREFVGYIHSIRPVITPKTKTTEIDIIGASYVLKQPHQRVFQNVTADKVVQQIASANNFALDFDTHPRVYSQLVQPGISDFQFLSRLAQQCGYTFWVENTTIHFKGLLKDFNDYKSTAQNFVMRQSGDPKGHSIYSFNLTLGESIKYFDAQKSAVQVGGVDVTSGKSSIVTNQIRPTSINTKFTTEFFDNYKTDIVAPSASDVVYEAKAADERNRFAYRAQIEVIGTPNISPDQPIYLTGLGPDYSGYWVVLATQHHIVETAQNVFKYTTKLQIGSDSLGSANKLSPNYIEAPNPIKIRKLVPNVKNTVVSKKSVLNNGSSKYNNPGFSKVTKRPKKKTSSRNTAAVWVNPSPNTPLAVALGTHNKTAATQARLKNMGVVNV